MAWSMSTQSVYHPGTKNLPQTIGILCMAWLLLQIFLGAGSVWFNGDLFGGGMKAKSLWKYHR